MIEKKRREPVILDFGLAKNLQTADALETQSGQVLGTPVYMSPEQARGNVSQIAPTSDIYSLGVILYQLITARLPFRGSAAEVFAQILTSEPKPPSQHQPTLDPAIESICLKAMSKDSAARFATMREFGQALRTYLKDPGNLTLVGPRPKEETSGETLMSINTGQLVIEPPATQSTVYQLSDPVERRTYEAGGMPVKDDGTDTFATGDIEDSPDDHWEIPSGRELMDRAFRFLAVPNVIVKGTVLAILLGISLWLLDLAAHQQSSIAGNVVPATERESAERTVIVGYTAGAALGVVAFLAASFLFPTIARSGFQDDATIRRWDPVLSLKSIRSTFVVVTSALISIILAGLISVLFWPCICIGISQVFWLVFVASFLAAFPVVLLSTLQSGTPKRPVSSFVLRSMSQHRHVLTWFYATTMIGGGVAYLCVILLPRGIVFRMIVAVLLIFLVFNYARLIGRLAKQIGVDLGAFALPEEATNQPAGGNA